MSKQYDKVGTCSRCGDPFWLVHSNQIYCATCAEIVRKARRKEFKILSNQLRGCYYTNTGPIMADIRRMQNGGNI